MTNKITYTKQGDYLLPNLKLPEQSRQARQRMNNIRNRAEEIVNSELIYV